VRDQVIEEIKRLAAENGGKAPGQELFENRTGIKRHEWEGKYWTRWSEALIEAGLSPNEFGRKLDRSAVFEAFAGLIRELQRVPAKPEFVMRRRKDPSFPSYVSVLAQFESKAHMVSALKTWAQSKEGFADVVALLPSDVPRFEVTAMRTATKEGHVYLIKSGAYYKIGRGEELEKRVKQIRTALPDASSLEHSIRTDDPAGIEAYWHRRFEEKRANGEWFKLTLQDVAAFRRRRYQ
jgi:Meiotically up-regulated gene 113